MDRVKQIFILAALFSCNVVFAQITTSPYTNLGIGELNSRALSNHDGMGEVGIAMPSVWHINSINPALLPYNTMTVFEFGLQGESRTISNELNQIKVGTGGFKYLIFSFPIIKGKWTSNLGYMPYSSVDYNFTARQTIAGGEGIDAILQFEGTGGLNQFSFTNGLSLGKGLTLGIRASYTFGLIEASTMTKLESEEFIQQLSGVLEKTNYSGFNFGFGAAYRKTILNDQALNFGLTYDMSNEIGGERLVRKRAENINGNIFLGDTLTSDLHDHYTLPMEIGFGFTWQKVNKLNIGFDLKRSFWDRNNGFSIDGEEYRNVWMAGIGLEYTPQYNDVNSYIRRVKYRTGISYKQLPNIREGETIDDIGINFGMSFPIKGLSALNLAFKYGQRGRTTDGLVKEQYFKFLLGASINDRWFSRRKYN